MCRLNHRISDDYLQAVVNAYEHFFFHYKSSDLLVIETSEIDFVDRNEDLQELLHRLEPAGHRHAIFFAAWIRIGGLRRVTMKSAAPAV